MKREMLGGLDAESSAARERSLRSLSDPPFERIQAVLVVLTSQSHTLDPSALLMHIQDAYVGARVFFEDASGKAMGPVAPKELDLLIDFGAEGERIPGSLIRSRVQRARFSVGRASAARKKYTRLVEESTLLDKLERERRMQVLVLKKAGVPLAVDAPAKEDLSGLSRHA
jgi:hypothetical protein